VSLPGESLHRTTAANAGGCPAVCAFVNDKLDGPPGGGSIGQELLQRLLFIPNPGKMFFAPGSHLRVRLG
jgi:hypothetical protein